MKSWKQWLSLSVSVVLAGSLLSACGSKSASGKSDGSSDEFNFYITGSLNVKQLWETLIPMFNKQYPNIKVKLVPIDSGSANPTMDRLLAAKKSNKGSGDIDLYDSSMEDWTKGTKDDLWATFDNKKIPNFSKMDDATLQVGKFQAIPYRASSVVLAYNSAKVPNPPKTDKELYDWIRQHPGRFTYNDPSTGGSGDSFVQTAIYDFLPKEDSVSSDPANTKKWDQGFALLKELKPFMYQKGVFPKKNQGTLDLLANGEVDMIPAWSDMALEQINKKLLPDTTKLTQIDPPFTGGPTYLMAPKASTHLDSVAKFLNFVLTPEAQTVVVNQMYGYPGIKWSEMPQDLRDKLKDVSKGYRTFNLGDLGKQIQERWQREVASQ